MTYNTILIYTVVAKLSMTEFQGLVNILTNPTPIGYRTDHDDKTNDRKSEPIFWDFTNRFSRHIRSVDWIYYDHLSGMPPPKPKAPYSGGKVESFEYK